ncbi:MAG: DUF763 domain-containing protein, partial [Candidatus Nanohaloarchaea archaeon]
SDNVEGFVEEPQDAIASMGKPSEVLDLTSERSESARDVSVDLVKDNPQHLKKYFKPENQESLHSFLDPERSAPELTMPRHHRLRKEDLTERSIDQLQKAYEVQPEDYKELVSVQGVGPKSLRALALIAELIHDAEASREDPAKYSYTHGGKDGTPYPVNEERYDESIQHLEQVLGKSEVEGKEKRKALKRLAENKGVTG